MNYLQTVARNNRIRRRRNIAAKCLREARLISNARLAEKFDVTEKYICRIVARDCLTKPGAGGRKLTYDDAEMIRQLVAGRKALEATALDHTHDKIGSDEGLSRWHVSQICSRLTYRDQYPGTVKLENTA